MKKILQILDKHPALFDWFCETFRASDFTGVEALAYTYLDFCHKYGMELTTSVDGYFATTALKDMEAANVQIEGATVFQYKDPIARLSITEIAKKALATYISESDPLDPKTNSKSALLVFLKDVQKRAAQKMLKDAAVQLQSDPIASMEFIMQASDEIATRLDPNVLLELDYSDEDIESLTPTKQRKGLTLLAKSGLRFIDEDVGGWYKPFVYTMVGQPGGGKTRFALGYCVYPLLMAGHNVVMFSLELSQEDAENILVSHHVTAKYGGGVILSDSAVRMNQLTPEQMHVFEAARQDLLHNPEYGKLTIVQDVSIETFGVTCKNKLRSTNSEFFVFDYAGILDSDPKSRYSSLSEHEIIKKLYKTAIKICHGRKPVGCLILNQYATDGMKAIEAGKPVPLEAVQGGNVESRFSELSIRMTFTKEQELAGKRVFNTKAKHRWSAGVAEVMCTVNLTCSFIIEDAA